MILTSINSLLSITIQSKHLMDSAETCGIILIEMRMEESAMMNLCMSIIQLWTDDLFLTINSVIL